MAVADKEYSNSALAVWTSSDGRTWKKTPTDLVGAASAIAAFGDRVVIIGAMPDSKLGMRPVSWSSTDGLAWVESDPAPGGPAYMLDDVAAVGDTLVAIGSSHSVTAFAAGVPQGTASATPERVWVSSDGTTWRLLAEGLPGDFGPSFSTHVTAFGGRVVVATQGPSSVEVFLGDPVR